MEQIKVGSKFYGIVRKGQHSKTLGGVEGAGRKIGPFTCTELKKNMVMTKDRQFNKQDWDLIPA